MKSKKIIIKLILNDLKHSQLTIGLKPFDFNPELHSLSMLEAIAMVLDIPPKEGDDLPSISIALRLMYNGYLEQANKYPIDRKGEGLRPLAEECFNELIIGFRFDCTLTKSQKA